MCCELCACTAMAKRTIAPTAQAPLTDCQVERGARALTSYLRDASMRRRGSTDTPLVPFAARGAALNLLTLERA